MQFRLASFAISQPSSIQECSFNSKYVGFERAESTSKVNGTQLSCFNSASPREPCHKIPLGLLVRFFHPQEELVLTYLSDRETLQI